MCRWKCAGVLQFATSQCQCRMIMRLRSLSLGFNIINALRICWFGISIQGCFYICLLLFICSSLRECLAIRWTVNGVVMCLSDDSLRWWVCNHFVIRASSIHSCTELFKLSSICVDMPISSINCDHCTLTANKHRKFDNQFRFRILFIVIIWNDLMNFSVGVTWTFIVKPV